MKVDLFLTLKPLPQKIFNPLPSRENLLFGACVFHLEALRYKAFLLLWSVVKSVLQLIYLMCIDLWRSDNARNFSCGLSAPGTTVLSLVLRKFFFFFCQRRERMTAACKCAIEELLKNFYFNFKTFHPNSSLDMGCL